MVEQVFFTVLTYSLGFYMGWLLREQVALRAQDRQIARNRRRLLDNPIRGTRNDGDE